MSHKPDHLENEVQHEDSDSDDSTPTLQQLFATGQKNGYGLCTENTNFDDFTKCMNDYCSLPDNKDDCR